MLKQNATMLAQMPIRHLWGVSRTLWGRSERLNYIAGEGITNKLSSHPQGHNHPSAWTMPRQAGGMAAYTSADVTLSITQAQLAGGKNVVGSSTLTLSGTGLLRGVGEVEGAASLSLVGSATVAAKGRLVGTSASTLFTTAGLLQGVGGIAGSTSLSLTGTASGALVSALQGSASFSITTNTPTLRGAVSIAGDTSFTMTLSTPDLGAPGRMVGAATVQLTGEASVYATGHLEGHITPFTELSPQSLAQAVWSAQAIENVEPGSMGEVLASLELTRDQVVELAKLHGLIVGVPLVVTETSRTAGPEIQQTIQDVAGTVTVERT